MKKITIFSFLFVSILFLAQEGIKFENDTFKNILAKAKKENKLVFLDAYTSWCGPCKMLERNVFSQKKVGDYYNTTFINAHFDMEKGEGVEIAKKYKIYSYPTLLFINGDGEVSYKATGYMNPEDFVKVGKEASNPENKLENKIAKFNAGESNPDFLLGLIQNTYASDFPFAQKVATRYFQVKQNTALNKDEAGLMLFFIKSIDEELYQTFLNRKTELTKFIPESYIKEFESQLKLNTVLEKSFDNSTQTINDAKFLEEGTRILGEKEARDSLFKMKMNIEFSKKNYDEYAKVAINYYQNKPDFDVNEVNSAVWNFYLYVSDRKLLQDAIDLCLLSIKKQEETFNTDTLANLYYKFGDFKNARKWAEKSIAIAKSKNNDYKSTEELLNRINKK